MLLCYRVTGTLREPALTLNLTLRGRPSGPAVASTAVEGQVGRSSTLVDFSDVPSGTYDLHVQLVVNGVVLVGAELVVPVLTIRTGVAQRSCP